MIDETDLDAAVGAGIVTQDQADSLRRFVASREPQKATERADDERFRFMRGFNDVFFAVGIVLFGVGLSFFATVIPFGNLAAAAITWSLALLVVGRMRMVLPGILLACLFAYLVVRMVDVEWTWIVQKTELPLWLLPAGRFTFSPIGNFLPIVFAIKALVAACAASIFYWRFKLPFTLLLIAASVVLFVEALLWHYFSSAGATLGSLVLLACGLGVFTVAMTYDLADRDRVTRRADCAFWLHLLAAPLIVHSLIGLVVPGSMFGRVSFSMTTMVAVTIVGVIAVLTVVALLIDRRALFVSALTYLGIVIGYTITTAAGNRSGVDGTVVYTTLLILGALVLSLGISWQPLRRVFVRLFPSALTDRLPRVAPAR